MFWYKFGRLTGYLLNLTVFAVIAYDTYLNITKSNSLILDIIAFLAYIGYIYIGNAVSGILQQISDIQMHTEYLARVEYLEELDKKSVADFERLLNDFGKSEWTLDKE